MRNSIPSAHGIYLHMPWCASICPYCAFYKELDKGADYSAWLQGVLRDWSHWQHIFPSKAHSIYFGGGTPSLAPPAILERAIETLPHQEDAEITLEVNPGSITADGLSDLHSVGVNRVSLGIQSLEPKVARFLARGHDAEQARTLLAVISKMNFRSWSVDLMFAIPEQTIEMLDRDIDSILSAGAPHISLYGLGIEPNTAFWHLQKRGALKLPDQDRWAELVDRIRERLGTEGYIQYEISNFSLPGHQAIHNGSTWQGGTYMGLGPSAHGFAPSGLRWQNPANIDAWLTQPPVNGEFPTPKEAAVDYLLSSLRHIQGSDLHYMAKRTGHEPSKHHLSELIANGMLVHEASSIRLTEKAIPISDAIVRRLCEGMIQTQPNSSMVQ